MIIINLRFITLSWVFPSPQSNNWLDSIKDWLLQLDQTRNQPDQSQIYKYNLKASDPPSSDWHGQYLPKLHQLVLEHVRLRIARIIHSTCTRYHCYHQSSSSSSSKQLYKLHELIFKRMGENAFIPPTRSEKSLLSS